VADVPAQRGPLHMSEARGQVGFSDPAGWSQSGPLFSASVSASTNVLLVGQESSDVEDLRLLDV